MSKQQKSTVEIRLRLAELVELAGSEVDAAKILREATGCDMTHDAITRMLRGLTKPSIVYLSVYVLESKLKG